MPVKIDLSEVAKPDIIQLLDYEVILSYLILDLKKRAPAFLDLTESDPAYKILEVVAYREYMLRYKVNEAGQNVMLAYATGINLDNLAALYSVKRLVKQKADPLAIPPKKLIMEDDATLRDRILLSLNSISTCGARLNYIFYAKSASGLILDATAFSENPGEVTISLLINSKDPKIINKILADTAKICNAEEVRPLTDTVNVILAKEKQIDIEATIYFLRGPDTTVIYNKAKENLNKYIEKHKKIGVDFNLSGIYAALHIQGVQRVSITKPTTNVVLDNKTHGNVKTINIINGGQVDA